MEFSLEIKIPPPFFYIFAYCSRIPQLHTDCLNSSNILLIVLMDTALTSTAAQAQRLLRLLFLQVGQ